MVLKIGMIEKSKACISRMWKDIEKYKGLIVAFLIYYLFMKFLFRAFCPLVIVTGFPCPGCGMTRAIFYILTGQFVRGWNLNPSAVLWIALVLWSIYRRYWCGKKITGLKQAAIVILVIMVIVYGYRMLTEFPSYAPIVYTRGNLFSEIFKGYQEGLRSLNII